MGLLARLLPLCLAAGCFSPPTRACAVRCGAGESCAPGSACLDDGFCHTAGEPQLCGAEPDAASDAPVVADAPPPADAAPDGPSGPQTVTFGDRTGATFPGTAVDTYIDGSNKGNNYGAASALKNDGSPVRRALFRFDLSSIPAGATILTADLRVFTNADNLETGEIELYSLRASESWDEGAQDGAAGFANYDDRTAGTPWLTGGAGVGSNLDLLATFAPAATDTEYTVSLPVTTIQGWHDLPATNTGLVLKPTSGSAGCELVSREGEATRRPVLEVTYQP